MRRSRAQRRIRQVQFHLPPSGITEVVYGDEAKGTGRAPGGEASQCAGRGTALRVRPGTKQALAELMKWAGLEEQGEALTLMIHHLHGLGPDRALPLLTPPATKSPYRQLWRGGLI